MQCVVVVSKGTDTIFSEFIDTYSFKLTKKYKVRNHNRFVSKDMGLREFLNDFRLRVLKHVVLGNLQPAGIVNTHP